MKTRVSATFNKKPGVQIIKSLREAGFSIFERDRITRAIKDVTDTASSSFNIFIMNETRNYEAMKTIYNECGQSSNLQELFKKIVESPTFLALTIEVIND